MTTFNVGLVGPSTGDGYDFTAVTALVLGGVSLSGGRGNILPNALVGVLFLYIIENPCPLHSVTIEGCVENRKDITAGGSKYNSNSLSYFFTDGYSNVAVHKFSAQGELIKTWGGLGTEPGKFLVPHGIWIDKLDRVWVADREGNSVQVFDEEGTCLAYVSKGLFQPSEIWSDDEFIYVGERGGLTVFNMDLEIVAQIGYYLSNLMLHGVCGNSKS